MKKLLLCIILLPMLTQAQETKEERKQSRAKEVGEFSFGMRSTISLFDHNGFPGLGFGGMFRMRPGKRINTEWYSDYIKTNIADLGYRETVHIGWSVMIYPFNTETKKGNWTPYFIGGNCFDYAKINTNLYFPSGSNDAIKQSASRVTTAVQGGIGTNYHLTDRFNLSFSGQFMEHIGKEIHGDIVNSAGTEVTDKSKYKEQGNHLQIAGGNQDVVLSGHLLLTFSLNIVLFDMAK